MNIFDINPKQMDDLASDYLTGMYESQYDNDTRYVSNCCSTEMNPNSSICPDCKEHCVPIVNKNEIKSVTPDEVKLLEDIPF